MPAYNYICHGCQLTSTRVMSFKEFDKVKKKKLKCEKCGKEIKRVLLVSPKIKFKGKGFYSNDSKTKKSSD